jgi:hypothetical protein
MVTSTTDNPEKQTVRVRLKRAIFVRGQGAKKPGEIVELEAEEAAHLRYYELFEEVRPEEPAVAEQ